MSDTPEVRIGDRVFFWTGRDSQGHGTVRAIVRGRAFIDPEPDATKGSDYRVYPPGAAKPDFWAPRDFGVRLETLNTPPEPWFKDN